LTTDHIASGPAAGNDRARRQERLTFRANPRNNLDYVMMLEGCVAHHGHHVHLTYVPDKLVLAAESFGVYLAAFDAGAPPMIELVAFDILDDINNEIVPRWVQVIVTAPHDGPGPQPQKVIVEDRQPNWDNPRVLAHLRIP
jgi:7-cyano-7-deazaguanine reductase